MLSKTAIGSTIISNGMMRYFLDIPLREVPISWLLEWIAQFLVSNRIRSALRARRIGTELSSTHIMLATRMTVRRMPVS